MSKRILLFNIIYYAVTFIFIERGMGDSSSSLGYGYFIFIFLIIAAGALIFLLIKKIIRPKSVLDKIIATPVLSVAFFIIVSSFGKLHLSANYFGDLIKKETGRTAQEYIQAKLIDAAKERMSDRNKSIGEIAYELGFKYPQHFARLFKQRVGYTPQAYRSLN